MPRGRILLYSHDTYGIGNIRRTLELCRALVARLPEASILVITGSATADRFQYPPNVDLIKLPEVRREARGIYGPRARGFQSEQIRSLRSEICRTAMRRFSPDVVIVDKAPLGVDQELRPALEDLRRQRPDCVRILGLRDILDDPAWIREAWAKDGTPQEMLEFFDGIWVFGSPAIFDMAREYSMPRELARRVEYLGYIGRTEERAPIEETRADLELPEGPLVCVTTGGGEDGSALFHAYADVLPLLAERRPEVCSVLVTGPRAPKAVAERVRKACEAVPNAKWLEFHPRVLDLMNASTCVVSMAGYNTSCEILLLRKPALLIPRSAPVLEQRVRAKRLAEVGAARVLYPEHVTREKMLAELEVLLDGWQPAKSAAKLAPFTGLPDAAERVAQMFAARAKTQAAGAR